ncbi:CHASE2 domain-containing protein [Cylindrospermum sp. FACHB-282]|uniref:CHASE2 domain-containing protein n=1 Tax=Cylindrospermum sp. FACHB-282 TaxID=2692794 RepID=UPI001685A53E|nr:CHASE2 domain-containing protein [Cylindrospermum sp. FACHB-282]MBD2387114.1 CHASE2 domain-containing protein [Cylindrospermum sp. FACHB-282]
MSYCINPWCIDRQNPDDQDYCQSCGSSLIINERYRIISPLRQLNRNHHTEIFEVDNLGTTKVLKVLTSNRLRLRELFEQEDSILRQLTHLGVPQVDTCFTFKLKDSCRQLHCLVMDKIPGHNLIQWLQQNGVLSEELAIDWLLQLIKLLAELHKEQIIHRDIKPSNIMLRPDQQLVFIDFGAARRVTTTYIEKLDTGDITRVYSSGYTPMEQIKGQAIYQSDFFALGCSFVHLLTGIHPNDLPKDPQTDHLLWRDQAPHISDELAKVIDAMIAPIAQNRLQQPQIVLEQLKAEQCQRLQIHKFSGGKKNIFRLSKKAVFQNFVNTCSHICEGLILSLVIALAIIGIRYMGMLQPFELQAFDRLMAMRPIEQQDSRLLLVTIDEADIQYQNQKQMPIRWSLSDQALMELLKKLEQYQPRTIGIDIYRDFPVNPKYPELANRLRSDQRFFVPCKVPSPEDGVPDGISPPPEVPQSRLGFSDFVADDNEVVRRHLLNLTPPITSVCIAEYALGLQMALHYLDAQGVAASITSDEQLQIGKVIFPRLTNHTSGYQNIDASGYQILLNYRSLRSPLDIAQQVSLRDILEDRIAPELITSVKDRIVMIGVTAPSASDRWKTPYSLTASANRKQIPGIFVQAHAIAHILSTVLDGRTLIWWWTSRLEALWIAGWSCLGGILALCFRRSWHLAIAVAIALLLLLSICLGVFVKGGWIPLVPPALALIAVPVALFCHSRQRKSQ